MDTKRWIGAAGALTIGWSMAFAAGADPGATDPACERTGTSGARAALVLKRSHVNRRGEFIGTFEFRNDGISPALALAGERRGTVFMMGPPDTWIDFEDLNGTWKMLQFGPISHYLPRPDALLVKAHSAVQFDAYLFPRELLRTDGAAFVLTVYTSEPRHCVVSRPFISIPARAPVTGFVSDPVPPVLGRPENSAVKAKLK